MRDVIRLLRNANLALRFGLELCALYLLGDWGWLAFDGPLRAVMMVTLPVAAAGLWGTFRIPGDPKPQPPVSVRGATRLVVEMIVMVTPIVLLAPYRPTFAWIDGALVALHYTAGGRLLFLIRHF